MLAFGNLNNGLGNGGLSYLNGNNAPSNANWNILGRIYVINILSKLFDLRLHGRAAAKLESHGRRLVGKRRSVPLTERISIWKDEKKVQACRRHGCKYN